MSYERAVILHKVLTELHIGMLFLAALGAVTAFFAWRPSGGTSLGRISDATFLGAAICGTFFLILAAITGFLTWPWDRLWHTPTVYSKVTYATLGLNFWAILIFMRLHYGSQIWESPFLSVPALICSLLALLAIVMAGSAGGHLGHGTSLLDPLFSGINPYSPFVLAPWLSLGIITAGLYFLLRQFFGKDVRMKMSNYAVMLLLFAASAGITRFISSSGAPMSVQSGHEEQPKYQTGQAQTRPMEEMKMKGHEQMESAGNMPPTSALQPAEGASVKIISPKEEEVLKGDEVPLYFKLIKGKKGAHAHAYVDGELMGMFKSERGTLTGIQPGHHTLEIRVVAKDHVTELDATDKVHFMVK